MLKAASVAVSDPEGVAWDATHPIIFKNNIGHQLGLLIYLVITSYLSTRLPHQKALFCIACLKTNTSAMGEQELTGATLLQPDTSNVAFGFLQNNYGIGFQIYYPILFE